MGCEIVHETIIRDVIDIISDVKNSEAIAGITNRKGSFRSIAQASSNLTLVFPVGASRNTSIDNSAMATKAVERKAMTMLQMLFSAINITTAKDAIEYISQFHTNLKIDDSMNVDQFMNALDKFVITAQESGVQAITDSILYEQVKKDIKNLSYVLPDSISESSIGDFKIYPESVMGKNTIIQEDTYKDRQNYTSSLKNMNDVFKTQLLDSDVKKANELIPSMMVINFVSQDSGQAIAQQAVIGVKAKLYPIDSADILNRIIVKNEDNNGFLKLIRATTREISFCRDFLFALDKAKVDALSQSKKGSSSKLWKILERRGTKSKIRRVLGQTNDASAITTLLISQEEVEYLKKTENINIESPKVIRPIMEAYNLMGVCIMDESMEVAKFIFDTGDDIYEHVSFSQLERESGDNSYKKVINLMTKMSR